MTTSEQRTPTVCLVDDDPSVRRSLGRTLRAVGYEVAAFASAEEFLASGQCARPGCLVLDVDMPGLNGLELQERLARENRGIPIVFITAHGDIPMTVKAIQRGAVDFLPKPFGSEAFLAAVRAAMEKGTRDGVLHAERHALQERYETLTPREREVFAHLLAGKLNKQVASALGTVEQTIKIHRARVLEKFGVASVAELVRIAAKLGVDAA
jgi:FixJ family two-component response regulator